MYNNLWGYLHSTVVAMDKIAISDYHLCREVFQNGSTVHSSCGPHAPMAGGPHLQVAVDSAHWELQSSTC